MSDTKAKDLGLTPLARIVSTGVSGLSPEIMGHQPALLRGEDRGDARALAIDGEHLIGALQDRSEKSIVCCKIFRGKSHWRGPGVRRIHLSCQRRLSTVLSISG